MKKILAAVVLILASTTSAIACDTYNPARAGVGAKIAGDSEVSPASLCDDSDIPVVYVYGDYPDDWPLVMPTLLPSPEVGGGSGGGVGGGSGAGDNDDGTRGTQEVRERQPGCLVEQVFMSATLANIAADGKPIGGPISLQIGDPLYNDGSWVKYQTSMIAHIPRGAQGKFRYHIVMHYMYNINTNAVAQAKLKNSYESGCMGIKMTGA